LENLRGSPTNGNGKRNQNTQVSEKKGGQHLNPVPDEIGNIKKTKKNAALYKTSQFAKSRRNASGERG